MQLIYFHTYGGELYSGVNKKILAQASHLFTLGIDLSLVLLGGLNKSYSEGNFIQYLSFKDHYFLKINFIKRFYRQYLAKQYIKKVLKFSKSGTFLYLRYPFPTLLFPHDLIIPRDCKIILECNSVEIHELRKSRSYFSYYKELIFGQEFRKRCDAIVGVTDEITHYQLRRSGNLNKPHITIGNGFEVDSVPIRQPPLHCNSNLDILCVATLSFWHGIDRLIRGIAHYKGQLNIQLHIVGNGTELPRLKKLSGDLEITGQIIFHGFVTGDDLDILFNQSHIAVGSLGIHRKDLTMTSELKCREYCSRGIPYIIACGDSDFPDDFPYILRLPHDESPIDMDQILPFASSICQDLDHPQKMRLYAKETLDWSVKMKKLKGFLEDLEKKDGSSIP